MRGGEPVVDRHLWRRARRQSSKLGNGAGGFAELQANRGGLKRGKRSFWWHLRRCGARQETTKITLLVQERPRSLEHACHGCKRVIARTLREKDRLVCQGSPLLEAARQVAVDEEIHHHSTASHELFRRYQAKRLPSRIERGLC